MLAVVEPTTSGTWREGVAAFVAESARPSLVAGSLSGCIAPRKYSLSAEALLLFSLSSENVWG